MAASNALLSSVLELVSDRPLGAESSMNTGVFSALWDIGG
jgi:hypothetical protein